MPDLLFDTLTRVVVGIFVADVVANGRDCELGRRVMTVTRVLLAFFWLQLIPHFTLVHKSYIEGLLTIVTVPAPLYASWLLCNGRDTLSVLSHAAVTVGIVHLPFGTIPTFTLLGATVPALRGVLIETVATQTRFLTESLGYAPQMIIGDQGYLNTFLWMQGSHQLEISVVLACTGLGSIAIFAGLIAAVDVPMGRKLRGLVIAAPIIYALNLLRTAFIAIPVGEQYFHLFIDKIPLLFGSSDPHMVPSFISNRTISQALTVVVPTGVAYLTVHEVPELLTATEDVLYVVTNDEYDLRSELGPD